MNNLRDFLLSYFHIPEKDVESVSSLFYPEEMKKNAYYQYQGQSCNKMSFIRNGAIRIYALADGKEITQWISLTNSFITDLHSFTFGTPARWNMQCLMDTTLYTITKSNYSQLSDLIVNWHELEKQFIVQCFTTMENRIFQHLSQTAQERYDSFFQNHKELFNQLPQQYIASMLGMSGETLSRIRANQTKS